MWWTNFITFAVRLTGIPNATESPGGAWQRLSIAERCMVVNNPTPLTPFCSRFQHLARSVHSTNTGIASLTLILCPLRFRAPLAKLMVCHSTNSSTYCLFPFVKYIIEFHYSKQRTDILQEGYISPLIHQDISAFSYFTKKFKKLRYTNVDWILFGEVHTVII